MGHEQTVLWHLISLQTVLLKFELKLNIYPEQPRGGSRGGDGQGVRTPLENHKRPICLLRISGTDTLEKQLDPLGTIFFLRRPTFMKYNDD